MERNSLNDWQSVLMLLVLPCLTFVFAGLAAVMFLGNLRMFHRDMDSPLDDLDEPLPPVSVLIPARDEEASIEGAVQAVLANGKASDDVSSEDVRLEVIVLDDGSTDSTGAIVRRLAEQDVRVRLIEGNGLPEGWNGKQHACFRLAGEARYDHFLFLDADVRLEPTAVRQLMKRKLALRGDQAIALLSAFPHQETGTILEKMLIPMMHFILLCYLPFSRMRGSNHPAYASGCGQLFLTDRESYERSGTHEAIQASRHDGLKLPKAYRKNEMLTDCIDGTGIATCRMYRSAGEVIRGLLKNANEGIANKRLLIPFTFLLAVANLLPWFTLAYALTRSRSDISVTLLFVGILVSAMAIAQSYVPRFLGVVLLKQSWLGALLHPLAILLFLLLQWWAFFNHLVGRQVTWRGRI